MVFPAIVRMTKKTMATIAIRMRAGIADLLGEALHERLLGGRLGLGRRVGEHRVDRVGDLIGALRVLDLDDVPADLTESPPIRSIM